MNNLQEYKIITGSSNECQKWLNQWKHEFKLDIVQMCIRHDEIVILLIRTRK